MPGMINRVGDHGVGLVHLVQRNAVQLQPLRTAALTLFDHRWEWCNRKDLAGHRNLGARVSECRVEDALTLTHPVYLGRIEQRDPKSRARCAMSRAKPRGVAVRVSHPLEPNCQVPRPTRLTLPY
jgi:hypothetical protein